MRHYFFDTSALTRLYVVEPGSRRVQDMVRSARVDPPSSRVVVSDFIHPEATSALRQMATGPNAAKRGLSRAALRSAFASLDLDLSPRSRFVIYPTTSLIQDAVAIVRRHGLRASDAVHLATAVFARRSLQPWEEFYFGSADQQLNAAAQAEGLEVIDPAV